MRVQFVVYILFWIFFSPLHAKEAGFFTELSLLYWKPHPNHLPIAVKTSQENLLNASVKNLEFEWDVGFKAGLGYRIPHDQWEIFLNFTSLQTHADRELKTNPAQKLFPSWSIQEAVFCGAKAHWRLHLGILDFLLRKKYSPIERIIFSPQVGISTAWIRQKYNLSYFGCQVTSNDSLIRMKNKFWGMGLYCGLLTKWQFVKRLSLFAQTDWRLLCGEFYLHQDEDLFLSKEKILGVRNIFLLASSILEAELGLMWEHFFSRRLKKIQICCSWNELILFSQNQLMSFVESNTKGNFVSNQGDLGLHGLEISFRCDF